jgi:hypothetical protein
LKSILGRTLLWAIALPIIFVIWPIVLTICATMTTYSVLVDRGKRTATKWKVIGVVVLVVAFSVPSQVFIYRGLVWLWHKI